MHIEKRLKLDFLNNILYIVNRIFREGFLYIYDLVSLLNGTLHLYLSNYLKSRPDEMGAGGSYRWARNGPGTTTVK